MGRGMALFFCVFFFKCLDILGNIRPVTKSSRRLLWGLCTGSAFQEWTALNQLSIRGYRNAVFTQSQFLIKPPPPSNLEIRNKRAWHESLPALFPPLTVMLEHSGISQRTGCRRNPWVTYPGSSTPKSSRVDCTCRRMGNFPHKAEL